MAEMISLAIITRPLYFVCEHVWNDSNWHIHKALAENESDVRRRNGREDTLQCLV
jgi:hypothetical protein